MSDTAFEGAAPLMRAAALGTAQRLRRRAMQMVFGARLYRLSLAGRSVTALVRPLPVRWPGDPERGAAIAAGELRFAGQTLRNPMPPWAPPEATDDWLTELHGFTWLTHAIAAGEEGIAAARGLVRSWIEHNHAWHRLTWRADVLADRLVAWIAHFDELVTADEELRRMLLGSIIRQARHLARVAAWEAIGEARLKALKGLVFAAIAVGLPERRLERALGALERELPTQVHADGGHISRSPAVQASLLRDLVDLRTALRAARLPLPEGLQDAIDRMAPLLRFFRHGDGRLAQFNGAAEEPGAALDLLLARSEAKGRSPLVAPHTGFQRLQGGKTLVLADCGAPVSGRLSQAGTLSFEMSHGRERLIVNCGTYRGPSQEWRRAARNTAAHSTLVVADTNSAEIRADGTLGRRPLAVTCTREEEQVGQCLTLSHDGYRSRFGLVHHRRLFLSAEGDDLRGEDRLEGMPGAIFAVRFHLHPTVQASLIQDGTAVLLRLPSGIGWRFRAGGAQLALTDSVYLGAGEMRKSQQLVLSGQVATQGATVLWAVRREQRAEG
jgi:uncharacterized heparinase superfamily protein